jgi:hypothetical protein
MASSLDPDNFPQGARQTPRTRSLGPGDSSDSGSDMASLGSLDDDVLLDPLEDLDTSDLDEDAEPPTGDGADGMEADAAFDDDGEPDPAEHAPRERRAKVVRKSRGQPHRLAARGRRAAV